MDTDNISLAGMEVLVVEDSPTQAEELKYILECHGYHVVVASNGRQALDLLVNKKPVAIISDIVMPEMDGYEFCRRVKADPLWRTIPVVLLTSLADAVDVIKGLECGADNFLTKPYDEQYLASRIQYLLANRRLYEVDGARLGVEIAFSGKKYFITSDRLQVLNLLLSTYETAVNKNSQLLATQDQLKRLNEELERRVEQRTSELQAEIASHKATAEKLERVNQVLRAIRNVNQLIVREKDRHKLLHGVCGYLTETRGYMTAWSVLLDDNGSPTMSAESGIGQEFPRLLEQMAGDRLPFCCRKAIVNEDICHLSEKDECQDCPLGKWKCGYDVLCQCLKMEGKIYGVLSVSLPSTIHVDEEEISLFKEMAGDLVFALHSLAGEEKRRQAEEALREGEDKFKYVFEYSNVGKSLTQISGQVYPNQTLCEMLGYTREELSQKKWQELTPADEIDMVQHAIASLISGEKKAVRFVKRYVRKDGSIIWADVSAALRRNKNGQPLYLLTTVVDITERKQAEDELREAHAMLERRVEERTAELLVARKAAEAANQAKTYFLSNMSHEIRTPLNAILGFAQLMQRDAELTPMQRQHLDTINKSGEHLLNLLNDILEMSKIEAGHSMLHNEVCDLYALVNDLAGMFRFRFEQKKLRLLTELADDLPHHIVTDAKKLRQVLINLLSNAVKFTSVGSVTLRMRCQPGEQGLRLHCEVEDTGAGIAEYELDRLFKYFEQTRSGQKKETGTGLGLAISQDFVQQMGGKITVESTPGKGSLFRFAIDVQKAHGNIPLPVTAKHRAMGKLMPERGPVRVLVVDDLEENRKMLSQFLQLAGFEVQEACDGQQAIDGFARWAPHLILMDMHMPGVDGYQATRTIKAMRQGKATTIIAVTASAFEENRQEMLHTGIDGYVRKPFHMEELLEEIRIRLGLEYSYAPECDEPITYKPTATTHDGSSGQPLPAQLVEQIRKATTNADIQILEDLLRQAAAHHAQLADELQKLAQQYDYEAIIRLLDKESDH